MQNFLLLFINLLFLFSYFSEARAQEYRRNRIKKKKTPPKTEIVAPKNGLSPKSVFKEKAALYGVVVDEQSGETLQGATLRFIGVQLGAVSNIDGVYRITDVPTGEYQMEVTLIGYGTKTIEGIKIAEGKSYELNIALSDETLKLETVVIQDRMDAAASSAMSAILLNAVQINSGYSGDRILRETPDLQFSTALRRMPGVALVDDKFLSVRGMFERYNSIMVNGGLIPFSDFERTGFDFSVVPTNLITGIRIVKSTTEDMYNGFSGGIVYITTGDIPAKNGLQINLQLSYNTQTTFKPFYGYPFNDHTGYTFFKNAPNLPDNFPSAYQLSQYAYNDPRRYQAAKDFNSKYYVPASFTALPDYNLSATYKYGKKVGKDSYAGFTLGANLTDRYANTERRNRVLGTYDTLLARCPVQDSNYTAVQSTRQQNFSLVANLAYEYPKGKITLHNILMLNNLQSYGEQYGVADGVYYIFPYARITQSLTVANQLNGEHLLSEKRDFKLEWNACLGTLNYADPGYKAINYVTESLEAPYLYDPTVSPFNTRFSSKHLIRQFNGQVKFNISLSKNPHTFGKLSWGLFLLQKNAEFRSRIMGYTFVDSSGTAPGYENTLPPELFGHEYAQSLFANPYIGPGGHTLFDLTTGGHNYNSSRTTVAPFAALEFKLWKRLRIHAGLRIETTRSKIDTLSVVSPNFQNLLSITQTFPLFFLSSIYSLNAKTNLRAVYGRNLIYPSDRDLVPLAFLDYGNNILTIGNPTLKVVKVQNAELRFEHFPTGKETIAFSAFAKLFHDPIEQILTIGKFVAFNSAANIYETVSTPMGIVTGFEFETWLNVGERFRVKKLENLSVFLNFTLTRSKAEQSTDLSNFFSSGRRLQGQAGYILNAGLLYNELHTRISVGLFYNRTGERIAYVGAGDKVFPSLWELPRDVLDFQLAKSIGTRWEVRFSAIDILNQARRFVLIYDGRTTFNPEKDEMVFYNLGGRQFNVGANFKF